MPEKDRVKLYEVMIVSRHIPCKCGKGDMVASGRVHLVGKTYEHEHNCRFQGLKTGCGAKEWFSKCYPLREEREVLLGD